MFANKNAEGQPIPQSIFWDVVLTLRMENILGNGGRCGQEQL